MRVIERVIRVLFVETLMSICRGSMDNTEKSEGLDDTCPSPVIQSGIIWAPTVEQVENGLRNGKMVFVKNLSGLLCNRKIAFEGALVPEACIRLNRCNFLVYPAKENPSVEGKDTSTIAVDFTKKETKEKNPNEYILGKDKKEVEKMLPKTVKCLNTLLGIVTYELHKKRVSRKNSIWSSFDYYLGYKYEPLIEKALGSGIREEIKEYIKESGKISKEEIEEIIREEKENINYNQFLDVLYWIHKTSYVFNHKNLYGKMEGTISKVSRVFKKHKYNREVLELLKGNKENIRIILDEFCPDREKDVDNDENIFIKYSCGSRVLDKISENEGNLGGLKIELDDTTNIFIIIIMGNYTWDLKLGYIRNDEIDYSLFYDLIELIDQIQEAGEYISTLKEVDEIWEYPLYGRCVSEKMDRSVRILTIEFKEKKTGVSIMKSVVVNSQNIESMVEAKEESSILGPETYFFIDYFTGVKKRI